MKNPYNFRLFFSIIIVCLYACVLKGQNLVVNPGFETIEYCETADPPVEVLIETCKAWYSSSMATPNHLNACHTSGGIFWSVPENSEGFQEPFAGESYAGLITAQDSSGGIIGNYREYIQSELAIPLTQGVEYSIGFHCSLADKSTLASDKLGLHLSDEPVSAPGSSFIGLEPALASDTIFETLDWIHVHGKYTATGGEKFITLGNFNDFYNTNYAVLDSNAFFADAYYYIDEVYVIDSSEHVGTASQPIKNEIEIYPNPAGNLLHIDCINWTGNYSIILFSGIGSPLRVIKASGPLQSHINLNDLPAGMYVLTILLNDTMYSQRIIKD